MITGSGGLLGRFMYARLTDSGWRVSSLFLMLLNWTSRMKQWCAMQSKALALRY